MDCGGAGGGTGRRWDPQALHPSLGAISRGHPWGQAASWRAQGVPQPRAGRARGCAHRAEGAGEGTSWPLQKWLPGRHWGLGGGPHHCPNPPAAGRSPLYRPTGPRGPALQLEPQRGGEEGAVQLLKVWLGALRSWGGGQEPQQRPPAGEPYLCTSADPSSAEMGLAVKPWGPKQNHRAGDSTRTGGLSPETVEASRGRPSCPGSSRASDLAWERAQEGLLGVAQLGLGCAGDACCFLAVHRQRVRRSPLLSPSVLDVRSFEWLLPGRM